MRREKPKLNTARRGRFPELRRPGEVVTAARAGEQWAGEELYRRYAGPVAAYLRSQGVDDVAGVTNDVFVRVLRDVQRFEGDARSFRSWLFTIAHGTVVDERRRQARRPDVEPADEFVAARFAEQPDGDVEDDALAELGAGVSALLGSLSADQRDVLLLRVVADLPVGEVAETLGKPAGAIRALQHRALVTLRRQLGVDQPVGLSRDRAELGTP
ncbi:MAG: RNA polymerase sigma factor [Acidimicrobiales bacterium]